VLHIYMTLVP